MWKQEFSRNENWSYSGKGKTSLFNPYSYKNMDKPTELGPEFIRVIDADLKITKQDALKLLERDFPEDYVKYKDYEIHFWKIDTPEKRSIAKLIC
jgi:hypothetical protein